jgi:hypothetical protein
MGMKASLIRYGFDYILYVSALNALAFPLGPTCAQPRSGIDLPTNPVVVCAAMVNSDDRNAEAVRREGTVPAADAAPARC